MLIKERKTNWKYILIILILAGIVGGGTLYWQWWREKQEIKEPEKIAEDEITDWKTYRNEEYRFEIKYPKDHELIEKVVGGVSFGHIYDINILGPQELSLSEYVNKNIIPADDSRLGKTISKKSILVAGIEAIKFEGEIFGSMAGPWRYGIDTFLLKEGKIYRISYSPGVTKEEVSSNEIKIFNQILSTFRFIKIEDVKDVETEEKEFGIFGDSEFYTVISGYLEIREKEYFEGSTITTAYFIITKFYDDEFRESVDEGINQGNGVNIKENGLYKFNLGCFEGGEIIGIEHEEDKIYIDEETTEKIINSSKENHVSIVLFFGKHLGSGCTCCNLAHQVRIYDKED